MVQKVINTNGLDPLGTGSDDAKTAFDKINDNFSELYGSVARVDGFVARPALRNLLINGDMLINQRGFAGGALAAGVFGYDRWAAGAGGCNVLVNMATGLITHTSGAVLQTIENPGLAGQQVTYSVEDPSGPITVSVAGVSGGITAGAGRRGVTLTVPAAATGHIAVSVTASGVTYKRAQLERGAASTGWDARPVGLELLLCQRYFELIPESALYIGSDSGRGGYVARAFPFKVTKRVSPSIGFGSDGVGGRIRIADPTTYTTSCSVGATDISATCIISTGDVAARTLIACYIRADAEI